MTSNRNAECFLRSPVAIAGSVFVGLVMLVFCFRGCREYPVASSTETYAIIEALYTACNTKNAEWLSKIEKQVDLALEERRLSKREHQAFLQIIQWAKDGNWNKAQRAAYQFGDDQRGRGITKGGSPEHSDHSRDRSSH